LGAVLHFIWLKPFKKDNKSATTTFLFFALALGILFVILQFVGFGQIVKTAIILQE
jgi:cytochrome c oxidase subunit 3